MSSPKDLARSLSDRLSKLSVKRGAAYSKLMTDFLLERLTARLLVAPDLAKRLVFKGGYVGLRVYQSARYTVDLDALLRRGKLEDIIEPVRAAVETNGSDGVWFRFEKSVDLETQGEYGGLRLAFRAGFGEPLADLKRAQIVNLDIGKGDPIVPGPIEVETPFLLGSGSLSWSVYPAETMVAEKLHALVVRGSNSSRSKDIFDLNLLLPKCDSKMLIKSVTETFRYRRDPLPNDMASYLRKIDRKTLKMGWVSATGDLPGEPDFDAVFDEMVNRLVSVFRTE